MKRTKNVIVLAKIFAVLCILQSIQLSDGNENTVFIHNSIESCKATEYYDINYFLCRECDPQSNLVPSENGKKMKKVFSQEKEKKMTSNRQKFTTFQMGSSHFMKKLLFIFYFVSQTRNN